MKSTDPTVHATDNAATATARSIQLDDLPALDERRLRQAVAHWDDVTVTLEHVYTLDGGEQLAAAVGVDEAGEHARVLLLGRFTGEPLLHWAVALRSADEWRHPPDSAQPIGSKKFDDRAVRSPWTRDSDGLSRIELALSAIDKRLPRAVNFVIYDADKDRWLKDGKRDFALRLRRPRGAGGTDLGPMIEQIVAGEAGDHSWTLMHRYNLCRDLLEEADGDPDALALLYAWLRYSAIRQLDWQRRYNTKPRELAHAQHRLTQRIAEVYAPRSEAGMWARLMLSTLGRGGEGQQIRDRILEIMHRNHIKERHGTWIEQWHQKLHNNTTPDDIAICQAYIEFLQSGGDVNAYTRTLRDHGVTRDRLEHFERPITLPPDDFPDRRDALIGEFHAFLRLLKSVHAGADLASAIDATQHRLDHHFADTLRGLLHRHAHSVEGLGQTVDAFTEARSHLHAQLRSQSDAAAVRDLLFVDLGLEAQLRIIVERFDMTHAPAGRLWHMARRVLANLTLTEPGEELDACRRMLGQVDVHDDVNHMDRAPVLLALAGVDRTNLALRDMTDRLHARLQPKAQTLGERCNVDAWTIPIFSEEVVRGSLTFVLTKLLRHLEPALRERAGLGGWQIISPGEAAGRVRRVDALRAVRDETFDEPTVVIAGDVSGDEDVPANVRAVLTPATPDIVSHIAVRARNAHVLLASCFDESSLGQFESEQDHYLHIASTPSGNITFEPVAAPGQQQQADRAHESVTLKRPSLTMDVVGPAQFTAERVGGKSRNLVALRKKLPEWVDTPPSAALTFGAFEGALEAPANRVLGERYASLAAKVDASPHDTLPQLRDTVNQLTLPDALRARIEKVCAAQGITLPDDRQTLWRAIRGVWASKWTDRAHASRHRLGIAHEDVVMAVLLQTVIDADYAFVIHTVDPATGDRDTLYGEIVAGLGETLVGNHPGRPLAFRASKRSGSAELLSFPSKSIALAGRGVIARSDSNAEDLPGYAGAGLHDSLHTAPPETRRLDYTQERLVTDAATREHLFGAIVQLGIALERAAGAPQDIEGAIANDRCYALQTRAQVGL